MLLIITAFIVPVATAVSNIVVVVGVLLHLSNCRWTGGGAAVIMVNIILLLWTVAAEQLLLSVIVAGVVVSTVLLITRCRHWLG